MKFIPTKSLLIASLLAVVGVSAQAQTIPYLIDGRGEVATSGTGLCWRTGYWTPQLAAENPKYGCACDKDLMPADKCGAAPVAAAPGAAPAAPVAGPKPASSKVTLSADALFDFDKAVLRPEGKSKLDDLASQAGKLNLEVIIAVGHTDRIGSDAYNQKLSERRAAAVKTYLVGKGVAANKVYTEGKGEKQPVTGDKCKKMGPENGKNKKLVECLQPDRRVEIEVIGTK
ncbi:MAG: OmpA family protein [Rhodocyclaceae bacterium]|nr:OmpA family protein [Rhodocyclaceae bacterium]